jgi:nitrogen fixation protein NifX
MSVPILSQELALRIGMAARVLPDTDPGRLMKVLVGALGLPITEQKLSQLTAQQLRSAVDNEFAHVTLPHIKQALDYLWGKAQTAVAEELPPLDSYQEGHMPGSIRVAVASNGGERLDGHFGTCSRFLVYQVSPSEIRLIDVRRAAGGDTADDKNAWRAECIADCHLLYVVSIGGPAAAKVVKHDVHPIKLSHGGDARTVLRETQEVLAGTPPPWLAKVMGKAAVRSWSGEEEP